MSEIISRTKSATVLGFFILLCFAAGGLGTLATTESLGNWYPTISKPTWNPSDWIFAPVWSSLFLMMAVAAWLVWRADAQAEKKNTAQVLFAIQLTLNSLWSFVFFAWHQFGWAVIEIIVLWIAIVATCVAYFRISKAAGWLLIPYLAWVSFASVLTFSIWRLNT